MLINPLGLYITGFDFVQDASAVNAAGKKAAANSTQPGNPANK